MPRHVGGGGEVDGADEKETTEVCADRALPILRAVQGLPENTQQDSNRLGHPAEVNRDAGQIVSGQDSSGKQDLEP